MVRLTILAVATLSTNLDAQQTIPELARTRPTNPIVRGRLSDVEPATLHELTSGAELVVDATLIKQKSYLTPDERHIFTDYELNPSRVFVGRLFAARATPLILTVYGGSLTIDGFTVFVVDHGVKRPQVGRRYLLFLKLFGTEGHYQLYKSGAFEIDKQALRSLVTRDEHVFFKEIVETPLDEVVNRIAKAAEAKKQ